MVAKKKKLTRLELDQIVQLERVTRDRIFAILVDVLVDETLLVYESALFGNDWDLRRLSGY